MIAYDINKAEYFPYVFSLNILPNINLANLGSSKAILNISHSSLCFSVYEREVQGVW